MMKQERIHHTIDMRSQRYFISQEAKVVGVAPSSDPRFVLAPGTAARLGLQIMRPFTVEY